MFAFVRAGLCRCFRRRCCMPPTRNVHHEGSVASGRAERVCSLQFWIPFAEETQCVGGSSSTCYEVATGHYAGARADIFHFLPSVSVGFVIDKAPKTRRCITVLELLWAICRKEYFKQYLWFNDSELGDFDLVKAEPPLSTSCRESWWLVNGRYVLLSHQVSAKNYQWVYTRKKFCSRFSLNWN